MKKIYKIIIAVLIIALVSSGIITYAYYATHDNGYAVSGKLEINEENVIEVSSFNELIEAATVNKFNDYNKVSDVDARTIIKFKNDIKLASNLVLTKDIHIDLNEFKLDLNDYSLTIKHGYAGCFMIYNSGTIESGENGLGKITVDLPNSGIQIDDNVQYELNGVSANDTDILEIINLDEKYTKYSALYLVGNQIATNIVKRPAFKTYDEVSNINSFKEDMFVLPRNCDLNEGALEACSYIYKDIDLPNHYLSSDINISYSTSNANILDNSGFVKGFGDVNLTVTISKEGWTNSSVTFPIHVVDLTNTNTVKDIAFSLIKDYLSNYYVDDSLVIKQAVILDDYYYRFEHALTLPKTIFDGQIELNYKTTNIANVENTNALIYQNDNDENTYMYEPSLNDFHLVVEVGSDELSLNMYSTYVVLDEIVAYYIANYLYGGSIIYDRATTGKELIYLNNINSANDGEFLYALKQYISAYNVTGISYSLKGDVLEDYKIEDGYLKLKGTNIPDDKESSVTLTVSFEGGKTVDIDLNVEYLDSNGTTLSSYLTYYNIYNALVPTELETYFDLPFATNNIAPYTCYDVAHYTTEKIDAGSVTYTEVHETLYKPQNMKISLWYDGQAQLVFNAYDQNNPQSFTNQLDSFLTSKNITLEQIASKTGANQAFYRFSIDAQNSLIENDKFVIIYNYKFEQIATEWSRYEFQGVLTDNNTSYLTVLGGLFFNTTGKNAQNQQVDYCVRDANFFVWIYNKFRPRLDGYSDISTATNDRIIPVDWLGQFAIITKDDTALSSVTDFSGIKYLTSVTEVDLTGSELSANVLNGISEMKALKKLVLKNCSLTDVTTLSKLSNQGTLKILDISNNNIEYFDGITTIKSLEKVYLYNNNATNQYYGSKGICNFQAFADLMRNGTQVYNDTSNNVPLLYAESNNLDDYRRLKEIAYQDKLKEGLDIRNLYDEFVAVGTNVVTLTGRARENNTNPFGLQTAGTLSWGYQGDATEGTKYIEQNVEIGATITGTYYEYSNGSYIATTDTKFVDGKNYFVIATYSNATYFYVKLRYNNGNILTVKYYVDRY